MCRGNETPIDNLAFGESLFRLAKSVCAAVMRNVTLICLLPKVYSEWAEFNLNYQSLFEIVNVYSELPKFTQQHRSVFRIAKIYSEWTK